MAIKTHHTTTVAFACSVAVDIFMLISGYSMLEQMISELCSTEKLPHVKSRWFWSSEVVSPRLDHLCPELTSVLQSSLLVKSSLHVGTVAFFSLHFLHAAVAFVASAGPVSDAPSFLYDWMTEPRTVYGTSFGGFEGTFLQSIAVILVNLKLVIALLADTLCVVLCKVMGLSLMYCSVWHDRLRESKSAKVSGALPRQRCDPPKNG